MPQFDTVVVIGTGVIGRSWARAFSRAGCRVRVFDRDKAQAERAIAWLHGDCELAIKEGFGTKAEAERTKALVTLHADLGEALTGAGYAQESGPERLEIKQALYREMDEAAPKDTILASSTSAIDISLIAGGLKGEERCIMAHPCNPPHIVPVVEILKAKRTRTDVQDSTVKFLKEIGQVPVVLNFFQPGFALNRIQAAVVRECFHLVEAGAASPADVDACIRDGLALRWAFFGNFGANHTNADGGITEYFGRYSDAFRTMIGDLKNESPSFSPEVTKKIDQSITAHFKGASVKEFASWRDRMIQRLKALKATEPTPRG
jgi:L-gulonate 3-dehydrogenase